LLRWVFTNVHADLISEFVTIIEYI
jgi:hypothetical protein